MMMLRVPTRQVLPGRRAPGQLRGPTRRVLPGRRAPRWETRGAARDLEMNPTPEPVPRSLAGHHSERALRNNAMRLLKESLSLLLIFPEETNFSFVGVNICPAMAKIIESICHIL